MTAKAARQPPDEGEWIGRCFRGILADRRKASNGTVRAAVALASIV